MFLLTIGVCFLVVSHGVVADHKLEPRIFSAPTGIDLGPAQYFKYGIGIENKSLFQAQCPNNHSLVVTCKLSITHFLHDSDSKTRLTSYGFKLRKLSENSTFAPYLQVFRLNEEKFIVSWIEYNNRTSIRVKHVDGVTIPVRLFINFVILSTRNGVTHECRTFGTDLTSESVDWKDVMSSMLVHLRGNEFGVTYLYSVKFGFAHEIFDGNGLRVLGPINGNHLHLDPNDEVVLSLPNYPRNNGNCQSNWQTQERLRLTVLLGTSNHYSPGHLMKLNDQYPGGYSTANGIISSCRNRGTDEKSWFCIQKKPNQAFNRVTLNFGYEPKTAILYSMPRGNLLTMTSKQLANDEYEVYLTVFDGSDGEAYRPVRFGRFPCSSAALLSHFFQDSDGYYCFSLLPYATKSNFIIKCYPPNVLFQESDKE